MFFLGDGIFIGGFGRRITTPLSKEAGSDFTVHGIRIDLLHGEEVLSQDIFSSAVTSKLADKDAVSFLALERGIGCVVDDFQDRRLQFCGFGILVLFLKFAGEDSLLSG